MTKTNFLKVGLLALASLASGAHAASYYVVVPVPGRTAKAQNINVTLQSANLPAASKGEAYAYDLKQHLQVTGEPALNLTQATWTLGSALPAGLVLSSGGVISGTPTEANAQGASFQVVASYKTKTGQQTYTLIVNGVPLQATQIVAGQATACAVVVGGGVKCWGSGYNGRLGNGSDLDSASPVDVAGLQSGVTKIAGNTNGSFCAIQNGAAKCWGYNGNGQLGNGTYDEAWVPTQVSGMASGVTDIALGTYHSCAVQSGAVKCWGNNNSFALGVTSPFQSATPLAVPSLGSNMSSVTAGMFFSCARTTSNVLFCWGYNEFGQVGDGSDLDRSGPVQVATGIAQVRAGLEHACGIKVTTGEALCWGRNLDGQLGSGAAAAVFVPTRVSGFATGASIVAPGDAHTCFLTQTGGVKCTGILTGTNTPVDIEGFTAGVTSLTSGTNLTCLGTSDAKVYCWGQLAEAIQPTPTLIEY